MKPFDVVLAFVLAVVGVGGTIAVGMAETAAAEVDAVAIVLVVAAALALVARRRWPTAVLLVVAALLLAYLLLEYPYGPIHFSFAVAVYTVACGLEFTRAVGWAAVAFAFAVPPVFLHPAAIGGYLGIVPAAGWVAVPFAIGIVVRARREAVQHAREESVRDAVHAERLRIVGEVHDVVGHGLAAIKMQADIALHVQDQRPAKAFETLRAISDTSTQALDEVRSTLAVLRHDVQRAPAPGLGDVDSLLERMRSAGLDVSVTTVGVARALPAAVDLAAYRILQESLTNALKHAQRPQAGVRLEYAADSVRLTVSNPTGDGPASDGGLGIMGMIERASAIGGSLTAGVRGDRFEVDATLPVEEAP